MISKKQLAELGLTAAQAKYVRRLMSGQEDPRRHPAVSKLPSWYGGPEEVLLIVDSMLEATYGVEGWAQDCGRNGVTYVNTGDTYGWTLAYSTKRGYMLGTLEDFIRRAGGPRNN